jgi:hypothetical protein
MNIREYRMFYLLAFARYVMRKTLTALAAASLVLALTFAFVGAVGAQTTDTSGTLYSTTTTTGTTDTDTGTTSPGLPDTGFGGDAAVNMALLLSSGLIALGGSYFLARKFTV